MLELYHWEPNTYYLKPLIALYEKGAAFTGRWFDPTAFEQFKPGWPGNTESTLQLEREGPILVHDGAIISSSFFMLEYINDALPGPDLCPGAAYEQYRQRAWGQVLTAVGADVSVLGCARYLAPVLRRMAPTELAAALQRIAPLERRHAWAAVTDGTYTEAVLGAVRERLKAPVKRIESTLASAPWLAGTQYSIADIDAFSLLNALPELAPDVLNRSDTPRTLDLLERVRTRPAVKAALALSRTGRPEEAFVPGAEASRWG
jgi:GSH-dependent disulfide-bond oxidoreductase